MKVQAVAVYLLLLMLTVSHAQILDFRWPIAFTPNEGQWPKEVNFAALTPAEALSFNRTGFMFFRRTPSSINEEVTVQNKVGYFSFVNPSRMMTISGSAATNAKVNYYKGVDSSVWKDGLTSYKRIVYRNVWKGIDIEYEDNNGTLRQTVAVHHDGNVNSVSFKMSGLSYKEMTVTVCDSSDNILLDGNIDMVSNEDIVRYNSSTGNARSLRIHTDFSTFFGGDGTEIVGGYAIDDSGNYYFAGHTGSTNLPTMNAYQVNTSGLQDMFLVKISCDGQSMIYGTYYGGSNGEGIPDITSHMIVGENGFNLFGKRCILSGTTLSDDLPIRGNTFQTTFQSVIPNPMSGFIAVFDEHGQLYRSTYIGGPGSIIMQSQDVDRSGNVYITAGVFGEPVSFITPGVVQPTITKTSPDGFGIAAIVAKLSQDLSTLYFATYFFAFNGNNTGGNALIHVDSQENVILIGSALGSPNQHIPVLNVVQDKLGSQSLFITKLNSTATDYIYSMFFGHFFRNTFIDADDNLYLLGQTDTTDYPMSSVIDRNIYAPSNPTIPYFTRISPEGKVSLSTVVLGKGDFYAIAFDKCNNIILGGWGTRMPIVKGIERPDSLTVSYPYICVLDRDGKDILYSTYYSSTGNYRIGVGLNPHPTVDRTGSLNGVASFNVDNSALRKSFTMKNAVKDTVSGASDALIYRIRIPVCQSLSSSISMPDTVLIWRARKLVNPSPLEITVELQNEEAEPIQLLSGMLSLAPGFMLFPASQSLSLPVMTFQPNEKKVFKWTVRYDSTKPASDINDFSFEASYRPQSQTNSCPTPVTTCNYNTVVKIIDDIEPRLSCTLSVADSIKVTATGLSLEGNPARVTYTLRNDDTDPVVLQRVRLVLPAGMNVITQPHGVENKPGTTILPGKEVTYEWTILFLAKPLSRNVGISVEAIDDYNRVVSRCSEVIYVDGITKIGCDITGQSHVLFYPFSGTYQPDTIKLIGSLRNPADTTQRIETARLSLTRASNLSLLSGEQSEKAPFIVNYAGQYPITWQLKASPVDDIAHDTVVMIYKSELGQKEDSCEYVITIERRDAELRCTLTAIDSVRISGTMYQPVALLYSVTNVGQAPAAPNRAVLSISSTEVLSMDSLSQPLSVIHPSQTQQLTWNLNANTSKYNRTVTLTVITEDSLGNELTRCEKTIFLPRISPALLCTLEAPDTIRYDLLSDTYSPNPFTASLALQNILDTAEVNIETEIDLTAAPHVALVTGETARKTIDVIEFRNQKSVIWNLTIAQRTNAPVSERITIRYRAENDSAWQSCEKVIVIEGKERTLRASCGAYGPDSLFGDPAYEKFIPEPAQLVYAITNTGTLPLTGCTATIIVPQDFTLVVGDATQSYGVIMPGQTVWREWSLVPVQNAQLTTYTVRWQWSCDSVQANDCAHDIALKAGAPIGYVLSPWKLRFEAEQGASLPAERTVSLWPGGGASLLWQSTNGTTWLDWSPKSVVGGQRSDIRVQPNTTAMPVGIYSDAITITAADPVRPPQIEVEYEIWKMLSTKTAPSPSGIELQSWPNPTSGVTDYALRVSIAGYYKLVIHDMYGRELGVIYAGQLAPGTHTLRYDAAHLPAGVYLTTFLSAHARATKMMVVRR